jgi:two-component system LytT family response regulator
MDKIRALIVDDEPIARRGIRQQLRAAHDVEIVGECANGREAVAAIRRESPDLVFLDVQMPLLDGFGVIEELNADEMPTIVFVTAYDEHAIRAFEVNALDYLLKPIDRERFQKTLARSRDRMAASQTKQLDQKLSALLRSIEGAKLETAQPAYLERIAIKEAGRVHFLNVDEIDWVCAQGNYVRIHAGRESHLLRETMDGMESKLDPRKFLRIRRSTIVRVARIKELQPLFKGEHTVILHDGTQFTSSRRYRKNLEAILKM